MNLLTVASTDILLRCLVISFAVAFDDNVGRFVNIFKGRERVRDLLENVKPPNIWNYLVHSLKSSITTVWITVQKPFSTTSPTVIY